MATPKLNRLAIAFMQRIQDPITESAGVITAGQLIRSVAEIESYVHRAGQIFFNGAWNAAQPENESPGSMSHKNKFLNMFPELFKFRSITLTYASAVSRVDISTVYNDIFEILDSVKQGGGGLIEVWDPSKLADCIAESDPFYSPPRVNSSTPGMILSHPYIYGFPNDLADPGGYTFTLNYIQNNKNPITGAILVSGGTYDVPFSEHHIDAIAEIAVGIYKKDDFQEDAGG